ncbi:hypothetical protein ASG73_10305 [Janibacter sp. Soil728]|uniref:hypothetical protein n=1 Tax=Janibacter sp. Soil728 TaxID=1736393 RepID=UPI0006F58B97|nr:hypothetical protein [Janibacter sp. Soil728]KRE37976.1 hypothetical protein ASG73_10305 [Janibacter sp. Soil728]
MTDIAMTTETEAQMIGEEMSLTGQIAALTAERSQSRSERRSLPRPMGALQAAREGVREARSKVSRLEQEQADATAALASLNARLDAGDETVSTGEIVSAEKGIDRAGRLLKPATADLRKAERTLAPLESDEYLAGLVADALESVTDVPVVIRKSVDDAPEVSPIVVVSQVSPTENYGTLDAAGEVRLTCIETVIDSDSLTDALEATGSEVRVRGDRVTFDKAWWNTPRLAAPSQHAVASLMATFARAWHGQVSGAKEVENLHARGYQAATVTAQVTGLFRRGDESLTVSEDGTATGSASFVVASQHERGECLTVDQLRDELTSLVGIFQETVGAVTEAGEIVSLTLGEVTKYEGDAYPWEPSQVAHSYGSPLWPISASATLTVTYRYEQAEV